MTSSAYRELLINTNDAEKIALENYGLKVKADALPGEFDMNFKIKSDSSTYILKISRPDVDPDFLDYQQKIARTS